MDTGSGVQGRPLVPVAFVRFLVRGIWGGGFWGSLRCRPCSWKARRRGTQPGPCAIGSSWRAVAASLRVCDGRSVEVEEVDGGLGAGGPGLWRLVPSALAPSGRGTGARGLFARWWVLGRARQGEALTPLPGELPSVFGPSVGLVLVGAEPDEVGAGELQGVAFWLVRGAAALV